MLNGIIRIAAVLLTLLLAGCSKTFDPTPGQNNSICFGAGSMLLRDDEPTRAGLKESFEATDTFIVYGDRTLSGVTSTLFDGVTVTAYGGPVIWRYSPVKSWVWTSTSDHYDFVAISPAGRQTSRMDIPGNLAVSTHIDITRAADNCDLLGATYRRNGNVSNPQDTVRLSFMHLTSAVEVVVSNSSSTNSVSLDSVKFRNLMVCGDAKMTSDLYNNPSPSWINTERNSQSVRGTGWTGDDASIAAGDTLRKPIDFMIPQRLDQAVGSGGLEANMPRLIIKYTPQGQSQKEAEKVLKDIVSDADGVTPITSWVMGKKYTYYISMRLDGGVLVRVVTTDWETIDAETPGLLI